MLEPLRLRMRPLGCRRGVTSDSGMPHGACRAEYAKSDAGARTVPLHAGPQSSPGAFASGSRSSGRRLEGGGLRAASGLARGEGTAGKVILLRNRRQIVCSAQRGLLTLS